MIIASSCILNSPNPIFSAFLLLDKSSNPEPNLCLPPTVLALPQPHPSLSLPLPSKPRAPRSQCGPAGPTTELTRR